ncbi:MAG: ribose-phosphate diphosphokinase [Burkholderiaceae bacterium]|nr:ribose-phosphate diphosphokinase [Burkholderiaceae bacterium]
MLLFALQATQTLGAAIAAALQVSLAPHEERRFEDGEHKVRPLADPLGEDCYVVQSLHGGPQHSGDEKLVRLLMMLAALRDHGARRVTAVVPYLAYARKDRRTQPFDPLSLRVLAQLLEAVGTDALITLEAHNPAAVDNAFRLRALNLDAGELFAAAAEPLLGADPVAVASPDIGGVKRVQVWREQLEARWGRPLGQAFVDKRRRAGEVSGGTVVTGDVAGCTVLLRDDLISTGGTLARAAEALRAAGAQRVLACAAHGLFVGEAEAILGASILERVFVTDSVPPFRVGAQAVRGKLQVLPSAPLFAAAIRREAAAAGGR